MIAILIYLLPDNEKQSQNDLKGNGEQVVVKQPFPLGGASTRQGKLAVRLVKKEHEKDMYAPPRSLGLEMPHNNLIDKGLQ